MSSPVDRLGVNVDLMRRQTAKGAARVGRKGPAPNVWFKPGNKFAAASNMSPESHARRTAGLFSSWKTRALLNNGEQVVTRKQKKRQRAVLEEEIALEHQDVQERARRSAAKVMKRLTEVVLDRKTMPSVVVAAASVILDRAYGKPTQPNVNANVNTNGKASEISANELNRRIEKALRDVETITGGAAEARPRQKRSADVRKPDRDTDSSTRH